MPEIHMPAAIAGRHGGLAPMLTTQGLTKRFGAVTVLEAIDFELSSGEVHALFTKTFPVGAHAQSEVDESRVPVDLGEQRLALVK